MADKLILLRPLFKFQKKKILSCKESLRAMLYNSFSNENMEFQRETLIIRSMRFSPVLVKVFKLKLDFAYLRKILRY